MGEAAEYEIFRRHGVDVSDDGWLDKAFHHRSQTGRSSAVRKEHGKLLNKQDSKAAKWEAENTQQAKPRKSTMKTKKEMGNIAAMISDEIVSVECCFHNGGKRYTYKAERALGLKEGMAVVVSSNDGGMKVVRVVEVHPECILENTEQVDYQWVMDVVDEERFESLRKWEAQAADQLYKAQMRKAKLATMEMLGVSDLASNGFPALPNHGADDAEVIED